MSEHFQPLLLDSEPNKKPCNFILGLEVWMSSKVSTQRCAVFAQSLNLGQAFLGLMQSNYSLHGQAPWVLSGPTTSSDCIAELRPNTRVCMKKIDKIKGLHGPTIRSKIAVRQA